MIEAERVKIEGQRAQNEQVKTKLDHELKMITMQAKQGELAIKGQIEEMKAQMSLQKIAVDEQSQIMRAQNENTTSQVNNEIRIREQNLKEAQAAQQAIMEEKLADLQKYVADLKAVTDVETTAMQVEQKVESDLMKHIQAMSQMMMQMENERNQQREKILGYISENGSDKLKGLANEITQGAG